MEIKVLFFAQLRDLFGCSEKQVQFSEGTNVSEAIREVAKESKQPSLDWNSMKFAVNEEFASPDQILKDQDTLVILPPVSGG
jgi:molybdopterin synthase sulfur carrier subunit